MKKIDLQETNDNLLNMLEKDSINRNEEIIDFIETLDFISENTSISINGDWGTGKTFFIKQVILLLKYYNKNQRSMISECSDKIKKIVEQRKEFKDLSLENNFVPVYYNAWYNDSHSDPILSLIYRIVKESKVTGHEKVSKGVLEKITSLIDIANVWSNVSTKDLLESFSEENITKDIMDIENAKKALKDILNELLIENGDKLILFIDELDRCNPMYAIKLLEKTKHFFDDDRIIFVFSTNIEQLSHTVSNYYGSGYDSFRYLNKFFEIQFNLQEIDIKKYLCFLGVPTNNEYFYNNIFYISEYYNLTMRECNRLFQSIENVKKHIENLKSGFSDTNGYNFLMIHILPILLVIKIKDIRLFMKIIKGNGFDELRNLITSIANIRRYFSYYMKSDTDKNISNKAFDEQLLEIYNTVFNNKGNMIYKSSYIELGDYSKKDLLNVLYLLKVKP